MILLVAIALAAAVALAALWAREKRHGHRLEQEIQAERERADHAAHAADAFFDVVGHELRSPIAAIIGYQELLDDGAYGDVGARAREPLDRIGHAARHLLDLIDGTLDLARVRGGTLTPDLETADLGLLIQDIAAEFRSHADERGLRHYVRIEHPLPTIHSDHQRLARALRLLVISAARHASDDGLELRVERHHQGVTVRICGAALPLRHDETHPAVRAGIRIAIATAIADLLGDELRILPDDDPVANELVFRIQDHPDGGRPSTP